MTAATSRPYWDYFIIAALAAVSYILYFHALGDIGFIGPDEPRYAAVAREMVFTGDYITPRLYGTPWFEKPPLTYWAAALSYKLFGINETGARFPSALGATLCTFLVYWSGRRLWNRWTGFSAAVILATSIGAFTFGRAASMDMSLTTCLTMALVFFLQGFHEEGPRRRWWFYAFYAALGLGVLAKGPVALILPALSLAGFLALRGKWSEWRTWHPHGIWIMFAVAGPWFLLCTIVNGWAFIDVFLVNQNFDRFTSTIHGHQRPFYFFVPVLLLLTFPWTFLLIPAARRTFSKSEHIFFWWAIVPFVFFSFSGSKLPGYILPMIPPIALLLGKELAQPATRAYKVAVFFEAGTMAFIGVAFGFYGHMLNVDPHVSGTLIAVIAFFMAAVLCVLALWLKPVFLGTFNTVAMLALVITGTTMVFPRFDLTDTMRPWQQALGRLVPDSENVCMYKPPRWAEYGLQYYRSNRMRGIFDPQDLQKIMQDEQRMLCIAEDNRIDEITRLPHVDLKVVHTIGSHTAFWIWAAK